MQEDFEIFDSRDLLNVIAYLVMSLGKLFISFIPYNAKLEKVLKIGFTQRNTVCPFSDEHQCTLSIFILMTSQNNVS